MQSDKEHMDASVISYIASSRNHMIVHANYPTTTPESSNCCIEGVRYAARNSHVGCWRSPTNAAGLG